MMLSMGLMLRPIEDYGDAPNQTIHLLGYFLPITLVFVLPMSALFAASLIYGRFAYENELDACRASGISLMTIIFPGLFLSLLVSIATLLYEFLCRTQFRSQGRAGRQSQRQTDLVSQPRTKRVLRHRGPLDRLCRPG